MTSGSNCFAAAARLTRPLDLKQACSAIRVEHKYLAGICWTGAGCISAFSQTFASWTRDHGRITNIIQSFSEKAVKAAEQKMLLDVSRTLDFDRFPKNNIC